MQGCGQRPEAGEKGTALEILKLRTWCGRVKFSILGRAGLQPRHDGPLTRPWYPLSPARAGGRAGGRGECRFGRVKNLAFRNPRSRPRRFEVAAFARLPLASTLGVLVGLCLLPGIAGFSQQAPAKPQTESAQAPTAPPAGAEPEQPLPGDWAPDLLYGVLSSPNEEAQHALLRATFAAGPAIIPQLAEALKDDRTAEYAAQSLAFIGGEQALDVLWKLLTDPRDLNLRRFTYGMLAEYESPQATDVLFDVINKSDAEPDRTVTETAVIALTVHTDPKLLPRLREAESKLQDVVIRDDLDNARAVIEARAKYFASPQGKKAGGSLESAVRTYFIPALGMPSPPEAAPVSTAKKATGKGATPPARTQSKPLVSVEIRNVTLSPDKNRALARVVFEDPTATAYYDIVLQKRYGDWTIASVWLGPEIEKPQPEATRPPVEPAPQ